MTLLGDAAHPTLQTLAQDACMPIEDAVCLAKLIKQAGGDFAGAFRRYERARYLRTARVQFESGYHWDNFCHVGGHRTRELNNVSLITTVPPNPGCTARGPFLLFPSAA